MSAGNFSSRMWPALAMGTLLLLIGMFSVIFRFETTESDRGADTVGFVILGDIHEPGWNEAHYLGIKSACEEFGLKLLVRDHVREGTGECAAAIEELAKSGAGMIFLASYGYGDEVRDIVGRYPRIAFATHSDVTAQPNISSYFIRVYQVRYLAGALAGLRTRSDVVGYVAGLPNAQANRQISAFALGVQRTNPDAKVVVAWTGTWADRQKETECVRRLVEEHDADVLTYHQDDQTVPKAADALDVDFIGFNARLADTSSHHLASIICRWDVYYRDILRRYLRGDLNAEKYRWIGLDRDAAQLADVSPALGIETGYELVKLKGAIENGRLDIFAGPLYDTDGILRCLKGETIRDETLLKRLDWVVKGVEFLEP